MKGKVVGVVGLGLIGGSLARAYKRAGATVYGVDVDMITFDFARMVGAVDYEMNEKNMSVCDFIFLAVNPAQAIRWLNENAHRLDNSTIVIDCCGIKRPVCETGFALMERSPFIFVGGHPMAGKQVGGFKNSRTDMFKGACFTIVPKDKNDIRLLTRVKQFLKVAGFDKFSVLTPEEHDEVIAFTSQLTHLISNAFVKSEMATIEDSSISGGSFHDLTRVAYLDETLWTELFMENRDNLLDELKCFMGELNEYIDALERDDSEKMKRLLIEGKERKEEVEKNAAKKTR